MKTKIAGILVCTLLITTFLPIVILAEGNNIKAETKTSNNEGNLNNIGDGDIIDQNNSEIVSGSVLVDSATTWRYAQSFKPSLSTITRVEIYMYKSGNGGWRNYTVEIKNTLDENNLTYITYNPKSFPYEDSWVEFDFPDISVVPGETYYIVCNPGRCLWSHAYYLKLFYGQPDPYKKGESWMYDDHWERFEPEGIPADFCFKTYGLNLPPNQPSKPNGIINGEAGESYNYFTFTDDPDKHKIWYWFDWGDGTNSGWIGPYNSGVTCETSHIWEEEGSYSIVVKAQDEHGEESSWSDPLSITMPRSKHSSNTIFPIFLKLINQLFPQLTRLFTLL